MPRQVREGHRPLRWPAPTPPQNRVCLLAPAHQPFCSSQVCPPAAFSTTGQPLLTTIFSRLSPQVHPRPGHACTRCGQSGNGLRSNGGEGLGVLSRDRRRKTGLRQDEGLLLGQGHQPFGVSQLLVLGLAMALVWQYVLLQACQSVSEALPLAVPSVWVLVLRQHHSLFH